MKAPHLGNGSKPRQSLSLNFIPTGEHSQGAPTRKEQHHSPPWESSNQNTRYKGHAGAANDVVTGAGAQSDETILTTTQMGNEHQSHNENEPEGYITKEQVAKRLKKTVRTVENWQRKGILPFVKAGRSVLFKWADVEAHLQRNFRVCHNTPSK